MRRRPSRSTLFPYTTLFRSGLDKGGYAVVLPMSSAEPDSSVYYATRPFLAQGIDHIYGVYFTTKEGDRKSTRLNSSHVEISYAVFCLKKKNLIWLLFTQMAT